MIDLFYDPCIKLNFSQMNFQFLTSCYTVGRKNKKISRKKHLSTIYKLTYFLRFLQKAKTAAHRLSWPISGVHSIIMEKSAQPGECGGARTPPSTRVTITYKVAVYASAERADTLLLPLYKLCGAA
jgi:hypothetical protein